jgi:sugar (pentulose or hexulose) kinase
MRVAPKQIYATGGASTNIAILQIMADVFNCPVVRIEVAKSAALGAALRAAHGWLAHSRKKPRWPDVVAGFTDPIPNSEVRPMAKAARVYNTLVEKSAACERNAISR